VNGTRYADARPEPEKLVTALIPPSSLGMGRWRQPCCGDGLLSSGWIRLGERTWRHPVRSKRRGDQFRLHEVVPGTNTGEDKRIQPSDGKEPPSSQSARVRPNACSRPEGQNCRTPSWNKWTGCRLHARDLGLSRLTSENENGCMGRLCRRSTACQESHHGQNHVRVFSAARYPKATSS